MYLILQIRKSKLLYKINKLFSIPELLPIASIIMMISEIIFDSTLISIKDSNNSLPLHSSICFLLFLI